MIWMEIHFFLVWSSDEIQTAVVTKSTPFNINHNLTVNPVTQTSSSVGQYMPLSAAIYRGMVEGGTG